MNPFGLGDLVNMPLPTEWTPEVQYAGGPSGSPAGQPLVDANGNLIPVPVDAHGNPLQQVNQTPYGQHVTLPPGVYPYGLQVPAPIAAPSRNPSPGDWRQPILPDSILPPALRRDNPLLGRQTVTWRPGYYDMAIQREARWWTWVKNHGGLKTCCRVPELGSPIWDQPPWEVMPSNARKLEVGFAQTAPGAFPSAADVILGSFQVPEGWDGVITRFVPNFVGSGFADFSGAIVWRLKVANRFAPDLGNVTSTYGSLTAAFSVPGINNIRLISGQTVYALASIPVPGPAGVVSAIVIGWFWPRR